MPAPDVPTIRAGNGECTVWQRLRFTRSVEHLPSVCFLEASERAEVFSEAVLTPFTPCTLSIGADLVLTGYCDVVEPRYTKSAVTRSRWRCAARPPTWSIARSMSTLLAAGTGT